VETGDQMTKHDLLWPDEPPLPDLLDLHIAELQDEINAMHAKREAMHIDLAAFSKEMDKKVYLIRMLRELKK
jgi:hypothetical protein